MDTTHPIIDFSDFLKVDIRSGTIIDVQINTKAIKPAYILTIDFGSFGTKTSSAQITQNYTPEELIDTQVLAVMNFEPKKVAGIKSEVLVLATVCNTK
jgi:tRNA-binding protein